MNYYVQNGLATGGDPTCDGEPSGCIPYLSDMLENKECNLNCDDGTSFDLKFGRIFSK